MHSLRIFFRFITHSYISMYFIVKNILCNYPVQMTLNSQIKSNSMHCLWHRHRYCVLQINRIFFQLGIKPRQDNVYQSFPNNSNKNQCLSIQCLSFFSFLFSKVKRVYYTDMQVYYLICILPSSVFINTCLPLLYFLYGYFPFMYLLLPFTLYKCILCFFLFAMFYYCIL